MEIQRNTINLERFETKDHLHQFLLDNKRELIMQKKTQMKCSDSVLYNTAFANDNRGRVIKELTSNDISDVTKIHTKLVINTTNIVDSHSDCHLPGIWNKTIKENKNILLLQEHQMRFNYIIASNVKASAEMFEWVDLGFSEWAGKTEALVFDAIIEKARNPFMFEQYLKGYCNEHSVGMMYVNLELAVNSASKEYKEEKGVWDKYINSIANKEYAENNGYFWAIHEAKVIEGSAVVKGSNYATPTILVESVKFEPSSGTQDTGPSSTPKSMFGKFNQLTEI